MLFTCQVINIDKIPKEIEEYSSLTHGTEFHFIPIRYNYSKCFRSKRLLTKGHLHETNARLLINPGQSVLTQDYPRKSLKLSDTPIEVQEKRLKTLFRVLVMIGYFTRVYQKLTDKHSC